MFAHRSPFAALTLILSLLIPAAIASAQGFIVDRRPNIPINNTVEVTEVRVDATLREQVAQVQVTHVFRNPGSSVIEGEYFFPLPENGAVQDLVLLVDGKEFAGKILPRDEARKIYEEIVRSKRDPALLEYMGGGLFKTSVFPIPPGESRTVTLRTTYVCRRDRDVTEFVFPVATQKHSSKPVGKLSLDLTIESREPIKSVYSPTHQVVIDRPSDRRATVKFEQRDVTPAADFRVLASSAEGAVGTIVLSYRPDGKEDGYVMVLASPAVPTQKAKPIAKTVVFVLDRSGSMSGKKIEQACDALRFVLRNLREGDLFNIVAYDGRVESFKPELQRYSAELLGEALAFVDNIRAGGSTNIDEALRTALDMLKDEKRPSYVLFLTDGQPTAGEKKEQKIADNAAAANKVAARIFPFGVGYDVNARLLDRVSGANGGVSEFVKPDDDLEVAVSRFYERLSSPVLTHVELAFSSTDINRGYPEKLPDLFDGGQLVWLGRYTKPGDATLTLRGRVGDKPFEMTHKTELAGSDAGATYAFVERLWAVRRIGHIIDQIDLHGKNQELLDELVALSKQHGILTPYTSFLADENAPQERVAMRALAEREVANLGDVSGESAQAQRVAKSSYMRAGGSTSSNVGLAGGTSAAAGPATAPAVAGGRIYALDATGKRREVESVRQVGDKTFYRRDNRWSDADVTPEEEAGAIVVEQFSDAYFKLARSQTAAENRYLTLDEEVTVRLGGRVYRIVPNKGQ